MAVPWWQHREHWALIFLILLLYAKLQRSCRTCRQNESRLCCGSWQFYGWTLLLLLIISNFIALKVKVKSTACMRQSEAYRVCDQKCFTTSVVAPGWQELVFDTAAHYAVIPQKARTCCVSCIPIVNGISAVRISGALKLYFCELLCAKMQLVRLPALDVYTCCCGSTHLGVGCGIFFWSIWSEAFMKSSMYVWYNVQHDPCVGSSWFSLVVVLLWLNYLRGRYCFVVVCVSFGCSEKYLKKLRIDFKEIFYGRAESGLRSNHSDFDGDVIQDLYLGFLNQWVWIRSIYLHCIVVVFATQGSDTRVCTKKTQWVFWVHPPKTIPPQKTHTSTLT